MTGEGPANLQLGEFSPDNAANGTELGHVDLASQGRPAQLLWESLLLIPGLDPFLWCLQAVVSLCWGARSGEFLVVHGNEGQGTLTKHDRPDGVAHVGAT